MKNGYALLTIKSLDDDARTLHGIATTIATDRVGDVVEPRGAKYKLPLPLLWQHDVSQPVGYVTQAHVTDNGIEITAQLAKSDTPGTLRDRLDEAWESIKVGLVRGLSIGFRALQDEPLGDGFARRFLKWEWLELSAVTIPANAQASITAVKSACAHHGGAPRKRADGAYLLRCAPGGG